MPADGIITDEDKSPLALRVLVESSAAVISALTVGKAETVVSIIIIT